MTKALVGAPSSVFYLWLALGYSILILSQAGIERSDVRLPHLNYGYNGCTPKGTSIRY